MIGSGLCTALSFETRSPREVMMKTMLLPAALLALSFLPGCSGDGDPDGGQAPVPQQQGLPFASESAAEGGEDAARRPGYASPTFGIGACEDACEDRCSAECSLLCGICSNAGTSLGSCLSGGRDEGCDDERLLNCVVEHDCLGEVLAVSEQGFDDDF